MLQRHQCLGKKAEYPLDRRLVGSRSGSNTLENRKISCLC